MHDNPKHRRAIRLFVLLALALLVVWQCLRPRSGSWSWAPLDLTVVGAALALFVWTRRLPRAFRTSSNVRPSRRRRRLGALRQMPEVEHRRPADEGVPHPD